MTNDEKIASAKSIAKIIRKAEKNLSKAKAELLIANGYVALDPSGETPKIASLVEALNNALITVSDEQYRWNTYLENRE